MATIIVIGALLIGTLTGALCGLLFAKRQGCKTRDNLYKKTINEKDDLKKRMAEDVIDFRSRADQLEKLITKDLTEYTNNYSNIYNEYHQIKSILASKKRP